MRDHVVAPASSARLVRSAVCVDIDSVIVDDMVSLDGGLWQVCFEHDARKKPNAG